MNKGPLVSIDEDTGHSLDSPYRGLALEASGDTLWELLEHAHIYETDQDGGDVGNATLSDYDNAVIRTCEKIIAERFLKFLQNRTIG